MYTQPLKLFWLWLFFPLIVSANFVHWEGDYDIAHQKVLNEHKPLLVLVIKKDSTNSENIIKNVFMNQPYVKRINQEMVAVIVMYEGSKSYPVEMYYTTVFPTLFFVDSGRELFLVKPVYGNAISVKVIEEKVIELLQ